MLVLTRKISEVITIGDKIEVTIVRISRDRVRVGITAPAELNVMRKELKDNPQSTEG